MWWLIKFGHHTLLWPKTIWLSHGMTTNFLKLLNLVATKKHYGCHSVLWWPKNFNRHKGVIKMGQGVATENFQSPSYHHYFWRQLNCFSRHKRVVVIFFGKLLSRLVEKFSKNMWHAPFSGNWKTSVAIWKIVTVG